MFKSLQSCSRPLGRYFLAHGKTLSPASGIKLQSPQLLSSYLKHVPSIGLSPQRFCAVNPQPHAEDHSRIWNAERMLSGGLIAVMPLSFIIHSHVMDYLLALSMVLHIHWGLEAVVVDYIRPRVFGPIIPKLALYTLYLASAASLAGLFYFNYTDVGLVHGLRMIVKM